MTETRNATGAGNFGEYRADGENQSNDSPYREHYAAHHTTGARKSKKRVPGSPEWFETYRESEKAITWTQDNPDAWAACFIIPTETAKAQGRKFAIQSGIQMLQDVDYVDVHGKPSRISHTPARAFGRIIEWQRPDLKGCVTFAASQFDSDGLPWSEEPQPSLFDDDTEVA